MLETSFAEHWSLDPSATFLNHGSFGAAPTRVLERQAALRARLEAQPVEFMARELPVQIDRARAALATFLHAEPEGLVFVANATTGINCALQALELRPGDQLLTTDHAYGACRNALEHVAARAGAEVVVARIPFPLHTPEQIIEAVRSELTPRTRVALLDHVTSPTGLVMPLEELITALQQRSIITVVDGAHAPGMLTLDLLALGADYYAGNCHKWLCAPKAVGFLYAAPARRASLRPLVISHGATASAAARSRLHLEFDWMGTFDPTPLLCVPHAIDTLASLLPGGLPALQARNRELALAARALLCEALQCDPPAPESMIGALASVALPESPRPALELNEQLWRTHRIEVPVIPWPDDRGRLLRISAQLYNHLSQYRELAGVLPSLL